MTPVERPERFAFVSMSFAMDRAQDAVYTSIVKACADLGYLARRADDIQHQGLIVEAVNELIDTSRIVIAELTGARPNVYHEVGYAHGAGKEVVLLARAGTPISWVLSHRRVELWDTLEDIARALAPRLSSQLHALLDSAEHDAERPRASSPRSSRRPVASLDRDALLAPLNLRPVDPRDDHRTLGELVPGFVGYTQSWILWRAACEDAAAPVFSSVALARSRLSTVTISCDRGGSARTELAFTHASEPMVVLAVRPDDVLKFDPISAGRTVTLTARQESDDEHSAFALVPLARIVAWRERSTPVGQFDDLVIDVEGEQA